MNTHFICCILFKYTSVKTARLFLHSFWGVASRVSDTFLDLFNPLESRKKMQVCVFLFRRGGSDEEVQREQMAPRNLCGASACSLRSEFVTRFCVAPRCLGVKSLFVCVGVKCSLTANERFVWFTSKVYNKAATDSSILTAKSFDINN